MENQIVTPNVLALEYRYIRLLGEGANGMTWLAKDIKTGDEVAIKELKLTGDLKSVELFEREADVLQSVNICGVPKFYKSIWMDEKNTTCFLIQEYIPYPSLQSLLDQGRVFSEQEVKKILLNVSKILMILQNQYVPPIIHRDIKPANILFNESNNEDNLVWLIDFGAVANPQKQSGGSTIAGTLGYMAPEQLQGEVAIQSDYYALGATALHLLTGVSPYQIDSELFKLQYEPVLEQKAPSTSDGMKKILASLLDPVLANRPHSVQKMMELIENPEGNVPKKRSKWDVWWEKIFRSIKRHFRYRHEWTSASGTARNGMQIWLSQLVCEPALECTYEAGDELYYAFIPYSHPAVRFFSEKDMPASISREKIDQISVEFDVNNPDIYRIPYQTIWLSSELFDLVFTNKTSEMSKSSIVKNYDMSFHFGKLMKSNFSENSVDFLKDAFKCFDNSMHTYNVIKRNDEAHLMEKRDDRQVQIFRLQLQALAEKFEKKKYFDRFVHCSDYPEEFQLLCRYLFSLYECIQSIDNKLSTYKMPVDLEDAIKTYDILDEADEGVYFVDRIDHVLTDVIASKEMSELNSVLWDTIPALTHQS